ncbi:MAG: hypothetical protein ACI39R_06940 [Lachnospiraceae bacterium]
MNEITELTKIDLPSLFISTFVVLIGIKTVITLWEWFIRKLGLETKWMRKDQEERQLLLQTSRNLAALQDKHKKDVEQSILHDRQIQEELSSFISEMKESMKNITAANSARDQQIQNLMIAQREVLADKINQKYKYYIGIKGIPEDEVEEFTNLHTAYKGCGGNHSGDVKYEYCMGHLPVIPVKTKRIVKTAENE